MLENRPGTSLAVRPSRPWKKDDPWRLPDGAQILPPELREIAPRASLLDEAKDWPACASLDPAGYRGSPSGIKLLNPQEIEIAEAGADTDSQEDLRSALAEMAANPGPRAAQTAERLRASAKAEANKELLPPSPKDRFNSFEARFLYCRIKRYDHFRSFRTEMSQAKDPAAFVSKWRRFVRGEMAIYEKAASIRTRNYQRSVAALEQRTVTALGAAPYLAGEIEKPHAKALAEGGRRIEEVLGELR